MHKVQFFQINNFTTTKQNQNTCPAPVPAVVEHDQNGLLPQLCGIRGVRNEGKGKGFKHLTLLQITTT